jgi:sugar lactone lactonase YvrE
VTTLAGNAGQAGKADGTGSAAQFYGPSGVAVDSAGNVYVADTYNHTIREVTSSGVVTTLAGSPGQAGSADGTASAAQFDQPYGAAVDSTGNVYVADTFNHTIRKVTSGGVVTTLAGSPGQAGSADGTGSAARFFYPIGVAVDSTGSVYVADQLNDTIRKVTSGGLVTTLGGSPGQAGGADAAGIAARFASPSGVAVDGVGNLYVADAGNNAIRKGAALPTLTITPAGGGNVTLTWSGGALQAADVVTGPYSNVLSATSPWTFPATGTQKYYRLRL